MIWGYRIGSGVSTPLPIRLDVDSHCNGLLVGSSGSGKSYALAYLLGCLLQDTPEIDLFFIDFKNSSEFQFMQGFHHYYAGNDSYQGVMDYYKKFCERRVSGEKGKRALMIFDEYPAAVSYWSMLDKQNKTKYANDMMGAIAEILMLGRGLAFGVWIVSQRADASLFLNGARDNFMVVLGLGRISREQKGMLFAGEDIPDKVYHTGEGILLADGFPLYEVVIPRIKNLVDWKKHIKAVLCKN